MCYYLDIFSAFQSAQVAYVIVGGLAVNLHGVPRMTQDIDVVIALDADNVHKVLAVLDGLGFVPRLPVNPANLADETKRTEWITRRNLKAFRFRHRTEFYQEIDIVLVSAINFETLHSHKQDKTYRDLTLPVAGLTDLIAIKEASGRAQDLCDVEHLRRLQKIEGAHS